MVTSASPGIGAKDDTAIIGDSYDGRAHGMGSIYIFHCLQIRCSTKTLTETKRDCERERERERVGGLEREIYNERYAGRFGTSCGGRK